MPVITMEAGKLNKDQKKALIESFTKTASEILALPVQAFVIILKENEYDNIGSAGKLLSEVIAKNDQK